MVTVLSHGILSRKRADDFGPSLMSHFTLDTPRAVAAETLLAPDWSLYGLDLAAGVAMFVQTPPDLDLSSAAFVQIAQFRQALRLITVALTDLPAVAALMPEPQSLILMFSMGRCGSTLASRLLTQVPGVLSLSEPGPYLTLALARFTLPQDQQRSLIVAVTRLLFRPRGAEDRVLALKFHSQVLFLADHFFAAFPQAQYVFQYRDGVSWAASFSRFMLTMQVPLLLEGEAQRFSWLMMTSAAPFAELQALHDTRKPLHHEDLLAPTWARHIDHYQHLRSLGLPLFPLRYNELSSDPIGAANALITHCHLPLPSPSRLMQILSRDSQGGTQLARTAPLEPDPEAAQRFRTTLSRVAPNLGSDIVLTV